MYSKDILESRMQGSASHHEWEEGEDDTVFGLGFRVLGFEIYMFMVLLCSVQGFLFWFVSFRV